jgi:hypothetical protein
MQRVVVVTTEFESGGGLRAALQHAEWISESAPNTWFIGAVKPDSKLKYAKLSYPSSIYKVIETIRFIFACRKVINKLENNPLVIAHGNRSAMLWFIASGKRVVFISHGYNALPNESAIQRRLRKLAHQLVRFWAVDAWSAGIPPTPKFRQIAWRSPLTYDPPKFSPRLTPHLPLRIIFIGRFDLGQKRQDLLIAALPLLTIKFRCTLVGGEGSDLSQIESLVKGQRFGVEIRQSAQTLPLLSQQDVLCLFSWFEAMPWVIQEAMMMSIPCLVSPLPEIQLLCGDSVLYADSAPEVATALNSLADVEIWRTYAQKASSRWDLALHHFFDTKRLALEMLEPNRRTFNPT